MLKEALVAPLMFAPPFCHWKVGAGVPPAAAVNVTALPTTTDWLTGWVVKAGALVAALTVSVAALLVTADTELVAMTV
jgi:hypothetical protein